MRRLASRPHRLTRSASRVRALGSALVITGLVLGACGGSDADPTTDGADTVGADALDTSASELDADGAGTVGSETTVDAEPTPRTGPIDGAIVSLLSTSVGAYAVDATTGNWFEIPIDGVDFIERTAQPIVVDGTAFAISYTRLPEQRFSHEVGIVAIDLATGLAELQLTMGVDRADDDAADGTSYRLLAVAERSVLVRQDARIGSESTTTVVHYDLDDGTVAEEFPGGFTYRLDTDEVSCEGDAQPIGSAGGEVYGVVFGLPARIDPDTGEVEPLVAVCDPGPGLLEELVDPTTAPEFIRMNTGAPPTPEQTERMLFLQDPAADYGRATLADGAMWWVHTRSMTFPTDAGDDELAIFGAVVRFDLASGAFELFPLGAFAGEFLDRDETGFTMSSLEADIAVSDGALFLVDRRDDRPVLRFDLDTGAIEPITIELGTSRGEPANTVRAELLATDPHRVWLLVNRGVRTENPNGSASTSYEQYLEQLDSSTGSVVLSIPTREIIGR